MACLSPRRVTKALPASSRHNTILHPVKRIKPSVPRACNMHELSIATAIVETAQRHAEGKPIEGITVRIGPFSGVVKESLVFYLDLLLEEKERPKAHIEIIHAKANATCPCGASFQISSAMTPCPSCGDYNIRCSDGRDCTIESIEVTS